MVLVIQRPFERLFFILVFKEGKGRRGTEDFFGFAAQFGFDGGDAGGLITKGSINAVFVVANGGVIGIEGAVFAVFNHFMRAVEDAVNGEFEAAAADIVQIVADNFSGTRQTNGGIVKNGFAHIAFPRGILPPQRQFAEIAFQADIGFAQTIQATAVFRFFTGEMEIEECLGIAAQCFCRFYANTQMVIQIIHFAIAFFAAIGDFDALRQRAVKGHGGFVFVAGGKGSLACPCGKGDEGDMA